MLRVRHSNGDVFAHVLAFLRDGKIVGGEFLSAFELAGLAAEADQLEYRALQAYVAALQQQQQQQQKAAKTVTTSPSSVSVPANTLRVCLEVLEDIRQTADFLRKAARGASCVRVHPFMRLA